MALSEIAAGVGGSSDAGSADVGVSCKIVKAAGEATRERQGTGHKRLRAGRRPKGKSPYTYTNLADLQVKEARANVFGVVCSFNHRHQSLGKDMTTSVSLLDESCTQPDNAVPCNFFQPAKDMLPAPLMVGDIIRVHRAKVQEYRGRPQLVGTYGSSWLIIRKKQAIRETFQRGLPGEGGSVGDGDLDPDEDSPPSGPDAGGGEADSVLGAEEWELHASSAHFSVSQGDHDRCKALSEWLVEKAPHLSLRPSAEPKVWVQDVFRRPQAGSITSKTEVDLICCLVSKHEKAPGGAGSLSDVYVADGTGFASSLPGSEWDNHRQAALLKGMRVALGKPKWSPGNPCPPPVPAHLKVEIVQNRKEWEALALSPGMWIRLRRLTVTKNRETGNMSAKMNEAGSSVNPLHPSMAEVQVVATAYAAHCASASGSSTAPPRPDSRSVRQPSSGNGAPAPGPGKVAEVGARRSGSSAVPGLERRSQSPPQSRDGLRPPSRLPFEDGAPQQGRANRAAGPPVGGSGAGVQHIYGGAGTDARGGGAAAGNELGRGAKRALPTRDAASVRGRLAASGGGPVVNLGTVRSTPAPHVFHTRARLIAYFPLEVEDFVRPGPGPGEGPRYLFTLRLEDDHGVLDAVASGLDAAHLLPGAPSAEQFQSSEEARARVKQGLAALTSDDGGVLELWLRSYLTPMAGVRRGVGSVSRASFCKRYSIVKPSSI